jgi:exopolysaccharide biosynthesis protein
MRYLGVKDALNLDGGGSTTLYVKDASENGIVNHPSDNKKFDRQGERFVVNSLLFIPR